MSSNEAREQAAAFNEVYQNIKAEVGRMMVGQEDVIEGVLTALLAGGHVLLEGVPGLGKTMLVRSLGEAVDLKFSRIQFTPDMMPADIQGTSVLVESDGGGQQVQFREGPLVANLVLADEINRATPKTQSALLEAMQEKQITVGNRTIKLAEPYCVMATQNPVEQEGTYPLPEAQLDRFLMQVNIDYPDAQAEKEILQLSRQEQREAGSEPAQIHVSQETIFQSRHDILDLHLSEPMEEYIVQMVMATRYGIEGDSDIKHWLSFGASPRGTISLDRCARAHAWLQGKDYVSPDDVQSIAKEVLRHRIILSFEAEANDISADNVIDRIIQLLPVT